MSYTPNSLSNCTIKNNISIGNNYPVRITSSNLTSELLWNVENNGNNINKLYDGTYITGTTGDLKIKPNSKFIISALTVPANKMLQIESGSLLKFVNYGSLTVNGNLVVNGRDGGEEVVITSVSDPNIIGTNTYNYYGSGIKINSTGVALINNMIMRYCGSQSSSTISYPLINYGQLVLINSSITNNKSNNYGIAYYTDFSKNIVQYNYLTGYQYSYNNLPQNLSHNYWGGVKPSLSTTKIVTDPINDSFIKTPMDFGSFLQDVKPVERQHFGESGINAYSGNYSKTYDDLKVVIPNIDLSFTRTYNSRDNSSSLLGRGWTFGFTSKVDIPLYDQNTAYVYLPNGGVNVFSKNSDETYTGTNTRNTFAKVGSEFELTSRDQIKYIFDSNKNLYKIIDKYGNQTNITVNSTGQITNVTDYTGRQYTLEYSNSKLSKITDPIGRNVTYSYNSNGLLSQVVGLNGKSTYYEYDADGYLTTIKQSDDNNQIITLNTITYTAKDASNLKRINTFTNESGKTDTYAYNETDSSTSITDQNNRVTTKYFDNQGYTIKTIEPNGGQTLTEYNYVDNSNKYGEVRKQTEITGKVTTYTRDTNGNIILQTNSDGSNKVYEYNNKNSITKEVDEEGNVITYSYNADGVTLVSKTLPNGATNIYEYYQTGIKGLVSQMTDGNGNITKYEYDGYANMNKKIDARQNTESYSYNTIGWLMNKTTPEGYVTAYEYDNVGNNTKITENNNIVTIKNYDYKNNLVKTINSNNNNYTYEYDKANNLLKTTDEQGNVTSYEYDIYNNVIKETKSSGTIYKYEYDNLNRNIKKLVVNNESDILLESREYNYLSGNTTVIAKIYTNATDYITNTKVYNYLDKVTSDKTEDANKKYTYTKTGNVSIEENEIGQRIYYYYNSLNKVSSKYEEIDTDRYVRTNYEYDNNGNVLKEELSSSKVALNAGTSSYITTNYTYDSLGNKIGKTTSSGEEIKYTYNKDNKTIKEEVKIEDGKYKTTEYEYNYAGKVTLKKEYINGSSLETNSLDDISITTLNTSYEYDNMNNLVKETLPNGDVKDYYYDKLNRKIKTVISSQDKTITTEEISYLYDDKEKLTSKKDGNGNITTYEYDKYDNVIKQTKPYEVITNYEYDLIGRTTKEVLPNNTAESQSYITYSYDKYNNVVAKIKNYTQGSELKQITTSYEYDLKGNLLKETTDGVSISSIYNKASKPVSTTDGNGNTTSYVYDTRLNVIEETNAKGIKANYYFDERNNLVKREIAGVIQEENSYNLINNKVTNKDELGKVTEYTYDINGNLIKEVNTDTGYILRYQYTPLKQLSKTIDNMDKVVIQKHDILGKEIENTVRKIDGSNSITTKKEYDNLSNVIKEIDGNGNVTTYEYNASSDKIKEINAKGQTTTYEYDKNNNLLKETDYLGNTLKYIYDKLDRLTEKIDQFDNTIEKLEYDNLGRQIKSINANCDVIEYTYDANDNILTKKDEEGNTETYEYDKLNNKTKYIDKNQNVTLYEYDNKNNLVKVKNALNETTIYTYDNKGNILTQKDANLSTIKYIYDVSGNEIKKIDQLENEDSKTYYPNGLLHTFTTNNGDIFTYEYDVHGRLISENVGDDVTTYEYDNNGNKTTIGSITKTYDELNRLVTSTENSNTVSYIYNDDTKEVVITDPNQNVTTEQYDKAGRLSKVINNGQTTEYVYNADGSLQKQINDNTVSEYEYYKDKMLKHLTTKDESDIVIEENTYEYDGNNNVLKDNDKIYTYDALNRIKTSNDTEYTYDLAGNIATKTILDGNTIKATSYNYNNKNQLLKVTTLENSVVTSESTYTYDLNGNQIQEVKDGQTIINTYSPRNELTKVEKGQTVSEYSYNAAGKRIQKVTDSNTTNFVYDNDNVILELDENGNQVATNTYGINLIKRTTDEDVYYVYNGHGDVTKVINLNNDTLNSYVYDEFGNIKQENGNFNNPFKYAGYYYDKENNTYYLRARYYNPEIQRFISEDTYRGDLNDPLSLNLYTYVNNNPLIYHDPTGHFFEGIGSGLKYITERVTAAFEGGGEFIGDTLYGLGVLGYSLIETGISEIGLASNYVGNKVGLIGQEQYKANKENLKSTIIKNGELYLNLPGNMINGIKDNFIQTFNWDNFKNYWDPNTSYNELKDYSKSVIQTGVTLYSGYQLGKFAYNKISHSVATSKVSLDTKNSITNSKADILAKNKIQGKIFENKETLKFGNSAFNVEKQITIKTNQGTKIRIDAIGFENKTNNLILNEFKSSATAPLTKNQSIGFPELYKSGGTVVGTGKGIFTGGYKIPLGTNVQIIRPNK